MKNVRGLTHIDQMYEDFMQIDITDTINVKGVADKYLKKYGEKNKQINRRMKHNVSKKAVLEMITELDNAGKPLPMLSVQDAVNENLIEPVFIGDEKEILKCAEDLKWDISKYEIIHEQVENNTAAIAAKLAN